jgi:ABC-type bacteriocin/lantibiotic exporter with double-glycine peptidase domain
MKSGERMIRDTQMQRREPSAGSEWRWLARRLRFSWPLQALAAAGLCGTSLLWLIDPLVLKWLIDVALPSHQLKGLAIAILLLLLTFGGRFFLLIASLYTSSLTSQRLVFALRKNLFSRLQRCSTEFFETHQTGDLAYLLEQDVDQVGSLGADVIPTLVRIVLTAVLTLAMMLRLNWSLTASVIIFFPAFIFLGVTFRKILQQKASRARTASAHRNGLLVESLTGAIQAQLLGALLPLRRRYVHGVSESTRASLSERKQQLAYSAASLCTVACATTLMLGLGGVRVIHGALSIGGYVAFYTYLLRLFEPLNTAIDLHSRLQKGRISVRKLMELEEVESEPISSGDAVLALPATVEEVTYQDVSFQYRNGPTVLDRVNLSLHKGERVVLAGASGSGKSTVVKLLTRLYELPNGAIRINNVDICLIPPEQLRRMIGVVPQEPILFEGTIRENLLLGARHASAQQLRKAIYCSCLEEVVARMPGGLDYRLGHFGAGLSGGEKQRLALARVLIQNRPILVLDEATSALDPEIKATVLSRLAEAAADKVVLLISHDSFSQSWATRGVWMNTGTPVEFWPGSTPRQRFDVELIS